MAEVVRKVVGDKIVSSLAKALKEQGLSYSRIGNRILKIGKFQVQIVANVKPQYFGQFQLLTREGWADIEKFDLTQLLFRTLAAETNSGLRPAAYSRYYFVLKDEKGNEYTVKVTSIKEN